MTSQDEEFLQRAKVISAAIFESLSRRPAIGEGLQGGDNDKLSLNDSL